MKTKLTFRGLILLFAIFVQSIIVFPQSLEDLLKDADKQVSEFNNKKALEILEQANQKFKDNWEVHWRMSRALVDIAEHLPSNTDKQKDEQEAMFRKAFDYADKSVKLASDQSITYLRRAIANGKTALFEGVFSAIGTVNDVKEDCEKAIQLGNGGSHFQALAHYVLGRTHAKVCEKSYLVRLPIGLGWGDIEEAIRQFNMAINLRPNFRMFYLDLGKAYIEEDEYEKAREVLKKIEKAPKADEDDDKVLSEAKNLLNEIKDE
ncbi:MAG: tetratricopeptide repeat protein [Ignavibacteriales bacterium]|nr:MAG: tetratricopeptide repeat protein [Ignavibacteriales bacterium]